MLRSTALLVITLCFLAGTPGLAGQNNFLEAQAGRTIVRVQSGAGESPMIGSYTLRVYRGTTDSFVVGIVRDRDGKLAGLWVVDLDHDGQLEALIWNQSGGSGSGGRLDHYRLDGDSLARDDLPPAAPEMLTQYMGHDEFQVVDGELFRSFPLYKPGDPNANPTGGRRTLVYRAGEGRWEYAPQEILSQPIDHQQHCHQ